MKNHEMQRRNFVKGVLASGICLAGLPLQSYANLLATESKMKLGLVTYLWGKEWTNEEIIRNCKKANIHGVELRSTHAHGVELSLSKRERKQVKKLYKNSGVELLGLGSAEEYDQKDPALVRQAIENTKAFIKLSHDVGGSGVKVRPNHLHADIPHEQTIEQIGKALNEVGAFAADYGQMIRVEVHGRGTQNPEIMKKIMDVATHPSVGACWNCNKEDLEGKGFHHNFNLLKDRFADTVHVRELNGRKYPYETLMKSLVKMNYSGNVLLECRTKPTDPIQALIEQKQIFDDLIQKYSR